MIITGPACGPVFHVFDSIFAGKKYYNK